ncbi:hypothetical protein FNV43_RR06571 [Rhamnella rubrinervis]|uniref:Small RNA 2'-O-methyltransferase n=1 Tax=Rhamnella rubrinervis TaxID=2594499 RepID=A0A8K0MLX1_9ROSA|nr:hypothetical protein FNV43_RR06571 [Rhamnella rubrinervis]
MSEPSGAHKNLKVVDSTMEERQYANTCAVATGAEEEVESGAHLDVNEIEVGKLLQSNCVDMPYTGHGICSLDIEGPDSGVSTSNGCLSCISYSVSLSIRGENTKELLESSDEFEFEIGSGSVISHLETVVTQMTVGQSAYFSMDLPPQELILAAADDCGRILSLLTSRSCFLEYIVTLLQVTEPLEDRMEQALFSPPLSKQRVGYAVQHIQESCATTLFVGFFVELFDFSRKIVGVDISRKSLVVAAKISILDYGFDIGTCLEVIEHMEEYQACLFGDVVLSSFLPKILIVSTPNYEYNVILQKSSLSSQEEDPDEKTPSHACKFRNHDHKFEWTREQFNRWATELAARHNYSVEFSGVGGSGDIEPGFASQIAVFRRGNPLNEGDLRKVADSEHHYNVVWEWSSSSRSRSSL